MGTEVDVKGKRSMADSPSSVIDLPDELLAVVLGRVSRALLRTLPRTSPRWHPAEVCSRWASLLPLFQEIITLPVQAQIQVDSLRTSLAKFANLKVLRCANLSLEILDDEVFDVIASTCPLLESLTMALSVSGTCRVTSLGLDALFRGCQDLQDLRIPFQSSLETEIPASMWTMTSLTSITLEDPRGPDMLFPGFDLQFSRGIRGEIHSIRMLQPSRGIWTKLASMRSIKKLSVFGVCVGVGLPEDLGGIRFSVKQLRWADPVRAPDAVTRLRGVKHALFEGSEDLPEGIGNLTTLRTLSIKHARLLPDSIRLLIRLRVLRLFDTEELPDAIGDLQALEVIHLQSDELTRLPDTFGRLTALTSCTIMCMQLILLPGSLGQLSSLRTLHLEAGVGTLPEAFGQLLSLTDLNIDGCSELQFLPDSFSMLTALTFLRLHAPAIQDLPGPSVASARLEVLELSGCSQLHFIADALGQISSLRSLVLKELPSLGRLPSLSGLQRLERLEVVSCPEMTAIEEGFGNHPVLKGLHLNFCGGPEFLPQSIGGLVALVQLRLTDCTNLRSLPESISGLVALEAMAVSGCMKLEQLPESMGLLPRLQLSLQNCQQLRGLPESFGAEGPMVLSELFLVNLASPEDLPPALEELPALKALVLMQCPRIKRLSKQLLARLSTLCNE